MTSSRALRSYLKAGVQDALIAPLPARQAFSLPTYAIHAVVKNAVSATLSTVIEGKKIHHSLDEAWCNSIADTVAPYAASRIGLAYGQGWIDGLSHKLAHGVVGGATGAILQGEDGILPGAFGAMMVETLGEVFMTHASDLDQEITREAADRGVLLHPNSEDYQTLRQEKITTYGNWAKMGTAISAVLLDQDVDVAIRTASYAADHNLIPLLMCLATVGGVLWTTYDVVDTYLTEGEIAALEKLAIEGALNLVPFGLGKLYKAGKLSIKALPKETIHRIWRQYCLENPLVAKLIDKLARKPLDHQTVKGLEQKLIEIKAPSASSSVADKLRLRTKLAFEEKSILDKHGKLTQQASSNSKIIKEGSELNNPEVKRILTQDGSKIEDWGKFKTESVQMPNGQSRQIHFYKNIKTGQINDTIDYKVKDMIKP